MVADFFMDPFVSRYT